MKTYRHITKNPLRLLELHFKDFMREQIRILGDYINIHNDKYAEGFYYFLCALFYR